MNQAIDSKVEALVAEYGYDPHVLHEFAEFVLAQPKPRKKKAKTSKKALSLTELKASVCKAFDVKDYKSLKKNKAFKIAISDRDLDFRLKETWLILYREWVGVPENERNQEGPTCINGIDVLKNFRPWHVFELDPKTATADDINTAFRTLAKMHHPDKGGNREVFEKLKKMRDSLLAFT